MRRVPAIFLIMTTLLALPMTVSRGQAQPAQVEPLQPAAGQTAPAQISPQSAFQNASVQNASVQSAPVQSSLGQSSLSQSAPAQSVNVQNAPTQGVPVHRAAAPSQEALAEANVAQAMRTFNLEGWTARPLEIYPKRVVTAQNESKAADMTPANQLYGLEPQMYDILAEFGMRKCYKRTYQRGQRFVHAAVYFFSSPEGAYGAYNYMRQGAATIVVRGAGSSEDDLSISFWKGKSFIRLSQTSEEDEESKEALRAIAKVIDAGIPPTSLPPLVLNQLPVLDRVNGTEKLVMGPNSGRKFFPAPYVGSLSLERARAAVTADYRFQMPPERLKLLVIDYGSKTLAGSVYEIYRSELDAEHDTKDVSDASTPTGMVKLDNGYMLVQLRGTRIFVIMGARKRVSPLMLARQIP